MRRPQYMYNEKASTSQQLGSKANLEATGKEICYSNRVYKSDKVKMVRTAQGLYFFDPRDWRLKYPVNTYYSDLIFFANESQ